MRNIGIKVIYVSIINFTSETVSISVWEQVDASKKSERSKIFKSLLIL